MVTLCFKEWLYSEADLRGEFWIEDGGQVMGADGDIGDYNHEGYVIEMAQSSIASDFGHYDEDWDEAKIKIAKEKYDEAMQQATTPQQKQQVQAQWDEDNGESFLLQALKENGVQDELYAIAEGFGDAREFGMKHWGMKKLVGNSVETWTLTRNDMVTIASGTWDAYQEEAEKTKFNVYVYTARHWFNEVPWPILESGNVTAVKRYESGQREW